MERTLDRAPAPPPIEPTGRFARLWALALAHPVLTAFAMAAAVRVVFAIAVFIGKDGPLIPDEEQYVNVAAIAADGDLDDSVWGGYGVSLYNIAASFVVPLHGLFAVFGVSRLWGQLLAAAFGALAAALTVRLALELVRPAWALFAGALVAFVPSQVLWSSVALRESEIWLGLVLLGVVLAVAGRTSDPRRLVVLLAVAAAGLVILAYLRDLTFCVAAWSLVVASLTFGGPWRLPRTAGVLLLALVVPAVAGLGVGGYSFVERALPNLGTTRTYLSLEADSAFVSTTTLPPTTTPGEGGPAETTTTTVPDDGSEYIAGYRGETYVVDDSFEASIGAMPGGLIATTVRPLPWQDTDSIGLTLARVENVLWVLLYVAAALGAWFARGNRRVVAYLVVCVGGLVVAGAVSQGNLGTAFRHRAQFLWALAVLTAVAGQRLADRRAATR